MGTASKQQRILVIDDDPGMATLVEGLTGYGHDQVIRVGTVLEGVQLAASRRFDLVLLDHSLPDGEGLDHIQALLLQDRLRPILYITAQSGSQTAIEAIKRGAYEYLSKPIDFSLLRRRIEEALEYRQLTRLPVMIEGDNLTGIDCDVLVGRCRAMQDVYKSIGRLSALSVPVLIEGEVGTGKEMIARAIHQHGASSNTSFQVFSAEEFNEEFNATKTNAGHSSTFQDQVRSPLDTQDTGTILVEEIGELTPLTQQRVLRWLQMPNSNASSKGSPRLIFSTTASSRELIESNKLRGDLFYFLSPYIVRVPSLRDREEDFDLLIAHFMQRLVKITSADGRSQPPRVSSTALELLKAYDWPGNIAQLKSVLQSVLMESRGAVLATDTLSRALDTHSKNVVTKPTENNGASSLTAAAYQTIDAPTKTLESTNRAECSLWNVADFVKQQTATDTTELYELAVRKLDLLLLTQLLTMTQGNQAQAARILGMTRTSLRKKIQACHIDPLSFLVPRNYETIEPNTKPEYEKGEA